MQQKGFNHVSFDLTNYKSIEKLLATQYLDIFKKSKKMGIWDKMSTSQKLVFKVKIINSTQILTFIMAHG